MASYRSLFFDKRVDYLMLQEVLQITQAKLCQQNVDLQKKIYDISTLSACKEGELSFFTSTKYYGEFLQCKPSFCIINKSSEERCQDSDSILLVSENAHYSYSLLLDYLYKERGVDYNFQGHIHPDAKLGQNVKVANNAFIGKNVIIGDNCTIGPGAVIQDNCIIGNDCVINANAVVSFAVIGDRAIIHSGVKIGQDGFGFVNNQGINYKVQQIGVVVIGNDVEIGSNSCIDRGAILNTKIGNGTKIDNLVQIAHNVEIGNGCFIAGCAAIAGSTIIGNHVQIGGTASIVGHIKIGDLAQVSGGSGVTKSIDKGVVVGGYPARPIREWLRMDVAVANMIKK